MEEEKIFLVLDENESLEIFLEFSEEIDKFRKKFIENPVVTCFSCKNEYKIDSNSDYYREVLNSTAIEESFPPVVPFWECCQLCRDHQASYYDVALLSDSMMEYIVSDKQWFFDELHIEKRWNMPREEIKQKAIEMRMHLSYILK